MADDLLREDPSCSNSSLVYNNIPISLVHGKRGVCVDIQIYTHVYIIHRVFFVAVAVRRRRRRPLYPVL